MRLSEFGLANLVWKVVSLANRAVNTTMWNGTAVPAENVAGRPLVDATHWRGTALASPATAGVPKVAIEAAGDFAQAAADKVWATAARALTDKTGFTLTAGSYSIRNQSVQRGQSSAASTNADITVSAVTVTKAVEGWCGATQNSTNAPTMNNYAYMSLNTTTTIRFTVGTLLNNQLVSAVLPEYV